MEQQDKFDAAIKAKLAQIEDEPSAQVWAGVRSEIGVIMPPKANPWPLRVAAAVALICASGLAYYLLPTSPTSNGSGMALHMESRVKRLKIVPLDREGKTGTYLAQDQKTEQQLPTQDAPHPRRSLANAPQPSATPKDSLKSQPAMRPEPEQTQERIVFQDSPKKIETPVPHAPDRVDPTIDPKGTTSVRVENAYASTNTKRSFKMPGREDINADNLKRKSGAILGAITNGANGFLGLTANYEEHQADDVKQTAFNADFGLFKIKKVRTVKH